MTLREETSEEETKAYQRVVDVIHSTVERPVSEEEAHEGARNLISFARTALAIHRRMNHNSRHEQHR